MKLYMLSLGCVKNQVDSEMILGLCKKENIEVVGYPNEADILLVNTCGFIESAKQEAIDAILELVEYKNRNTKLLVCGCLAQRYQEELKKLIPEVDRFIKIDEYPEIAKILNQTLNSDYKYQGYLDPLDRVYISAPYFRYVKISDGCTNRCAYCAIPLIRGGLKSRSIEAIVDEVKMHVDDNAKEINLISQDTTKYGYDLYHRIAIINLLSELVKIPGDFKIRLLYLYPNLVNDDLIMFIKNNSKVMPYFDIPIQHSEDKILTLMNRKGTKEEIKGIITKIRKEIPKAIIRTTLIVGFPHETAEDVNRLEQFIKDYPFDRLGVFTYSCEDDTKAATMPQVISDREKNRRMNQIMDTQSKISLKLNRNKINEVQDVLIEDYDEENYLYIGRSYAFAPDDIDGAIYVAAKEELKAGDIIKVKILDADQYTLTGEQVLIGE